MVVSLIFGRRLIFLLPFFSKSLLLACFLPCLSFFSSLLSLFSHIFFFGFSLFVCFFILSLFSLSSLFWNLFVYFPLTCGCLLVSFSWYYMFSLWFSSPVGSSSLTYNLLIIYLFISNSSCLYLSFFLLYFISRYLLFFII
jgi:hypothetical protein